MKKNRKKSGFIEEKPRINTKETTLFGEIVNICVKNARYKMCLFKKCRLILCSKRRKQRKSMNNIRCKCIIIHKNNKKEKEGVDGLKKNC